MARLPVPGSDDDTWGTILNEFLGVAHNSDGTLQSTAITQAGGALDSAVIHNTGDESVGGAKTFTTTISGDISGNATTVTTNANLTGPITSVGNTTAIASQTGTGNTFAMSVSPNLTGTPTAPTAASNTNTTQVATTAFVQTAVTDSSAPNASNSTPGVVELTGDFGGTYTSPTVVSTHLSSALPISQGGTGTVTQNLTATGFVVNAANAAAIAFINASGVPGYTTTPLSAISANLAALRGDNSTNDQPALANIVKYLGAAYTATGYRYTVYCPAGTYSMRDNGTIWYSGVSLIGDGPGITVFKLSNPVNTTNPTPLASFTAAFNSASTTNYLDSCTFAYFEVDGSGVSLSSYSTGAKALVLQYMVRPVFKNLYIHGCGATGLGCDFLQDGLITNVIASYNGRLNNGTQAGGGGIGIGIGGWGNGIERTTISDCHTVGNGTHGIFVELQSNSYTPPRGIRINGCYAEGNRYGISDWGADGLIVEGCQMINNLQAGFYVSASGVGSIAGRYGLLSGCVIDGNAVNGVSIGDTNRYSVIGNRISNNGNHGYDMTNVVNAQSTGMATMIAKDNTIFGNGYCGLRNDALLNNPYIQTNSSFNNGVQAAGASSNSGANVTYAALTITDASAAWTANSQMGKTVTVGSQTAIVQSNSATVLTLWPYAANQATAWSSGTPSNGTSYSLPAAPADRAALNFNNTVNHPMITGNRLFDDNGTRIQPYGFYITATGSCSNGWVVANDMLGNLTASFHFVTAPSGGVWDVNNGISAGTVSSPSTALTDAPMSYTGFVQPGNGAALGGHIFSGTGAPNISSSVAGDLYLRTDTPSTSNQRLYIATSANTWSGIV